MDLAKFEFCRKTEYSARKFDIKEPSTRLETPICLQKSCGSVQPWHGHSAQDPSGSLSLGSSSFFIHPPRSPERAFFMKRRCSAVLSPIAIAWCSALIAGRQLFTGLNSPHPALIRTVLMTGGGGDGLVITRIAMRWLK